MATTGSVLRTWSAIADWLQEHAPETAATLVPPDPSAQTAVEAYLQQSLPDDLADYLRVVPSTQTALFGLNLPLPASRMLADSAFRVQMGADILGDEAEPGDVAGEPEHRFSASWLTLTDDGSGGGLFVDLRAGELRGQVREWDKVDGSYSPEPRTWPSVAALLDDLLSSMTSRTAFMGLTVPVVRDGRLDYEWVDS